MIAAERRELKSLSDIQPLVRAPTAMPTGSATLIQRGSIAAVAPAFQLAPRKCTGTHTRSA